MTPKVSIIILNCNGREFLRDCLISVLKQSYDNFNIILIDNNSTDGSLELLKDNFPEVEIIPLNKNYGFSKGHNIGIKYSLQKYNPDYFFLLNNDIKIVQQDSLKRLIEIAESDKKIGILGCKLIYPDGKIQDTHAKITPLSINGLTPVRTTRRNIQQLCEVDIVGGAVFLIKSSAVNQIGLFDEGFSPFLGEEMDFCIRAKKCGYLIKIAPSIEVVHYLSQSLKKLPSDYIFRVYKKNCIRFMLLNFPLYLVVVRIFCEFYFMLEYLSISILEKKDKKINLAPWNLRLRKGWKYNLATFFSPYLVNIENLREIYWKRSHRTQKLWF